MLGLWGNLASQSILLFTKKQKMKKLINYLLTEIENLKSKIDEKIHSIHCLEYEIKHLEGILAQKNARISELEARDSVQENIESFINLKKTKDEVENG